MRCLRTGTHVAIEQIGPGSAPHRYALRRARDARENQSQCPSASRTSLRRSISCARAMSNSACAICPLARLLCRLPRLSGHRRRPGRALSARRSRSATTIRSCCASRATPAVAGARLQGRERGGPRPRRRLVRAARPARPRFRKCRTRAARCAPPTCIGMPLDFYFQHGSGRAHAAANTPPTRARASSASTTQLLHARRAGVATTSTPSSASA